MSPLFYYSFAMKLSRFHNRIATNAHSKYVFPLWNCHKIRKKHVDKQGYFLLCWFIDVFTLKFEDR